MLTAMDGARPRSLGSVVTDEVKDGAVTTEDGDLVTGPIQQVGDSTVGEAIGRYFGLLVRGYMDLTGIVEEPWNFYGGRVLWAADMFDACSVLEWALQVRDVFWGIVWWRRRVKKGRGRQVGQSDGGCRQLGQSEVSGDLVGQSEVSGDLVGQSEAVQVGMAVEGDTGFRLQLAVGHGGGGGAVELAGVNGVQCDMGRDDGEGRELQGQTPVRLSGIGTEWAIQGKRHESESDTVKWENGPRVPW